MIDFSERTMELISRYGEICNQQTAARILNVSDRTIARMLDDGRLRRVARCVDVRSIGDYIENPGSCDRAARYKKRYGAAPAADAPFDFLAASKHRGV